MAFKKIILLLILLNIILLFISIFAGLNSQNFDFLFFYRCKKTLVAMFVGSSLALSGASLQKLFQNPLADPHILGLSGTASLGAVIAFVFFGVYGSTSIILGALIGASLGFLLLYSCFKILQEKFIFFGLLLGILANSLSSSIITLLKTVISMENLQSITFFLTGSIGVYSLFHLIITLPLCLIGIIIILSQKNNLNFLSLGYEEASLMGVDVKKATKILFIGNSLIIASSVCLCGVISFLGLIIPHIVLMIFKKEGYKNILIYSLLFGSAIFLFFEFLSKVSFYIFYTEVPVGALFSLFLSPFFVMLIIREAKHA